MKASKVAMSKVVAPAASASPPLGRPGFRRQNSGSSAPSPIRTPLRTHEPPTRFRQPGGAETLGVEILGVETLGVETLEEEAPPVVQRRPRSRPVGRRACFKFLFLAFQEFESENLLFQGLFDVTSFCRA